MSNYKSLQHTKWECKYHVVFIPKYRKKLIYGELRRHLGQAKQLFFCNLTESDLRSDSPVV